MDIVEDGVTLSLAEYRVLKFCLANAQESAPTPVHGLHQALAQILDTRRRAVTRMYNLAIRRLLEASGRAEGYLQSRGLHFPESAEKRRQRWRLHETTPLAPRSRALSAEEIHKLLETRKTNTRATVTDLAWMYGVSDVLVYKSQRRYKDLSLTEIQQAVHG